MVFWLFFSYMHITFRVFVIVVDNLVVAPSGHFVAPGGCFVAGVVEICFMHHVVEIVGQHQQMIETDDSTTHCSFSFVESPPH